MSDEAARAWLNQMAYAGVPTEDGRYVSVKFTKEMWLIFLKEFKESA